jgi:hypothetical protein
LAGAIRGYLGTKPEYMGLSMCEVVLIDKDFAGIRETVGIASTFWSHVQAETLDRLLLNMAHGLQIAQGWVVRWGGLATRFARELEDTVWLDMVSLRQGTSGDFHVAATLELIESIGRVDATANGGYLGRAFCLLEIFAVVRCGGTLSIREQGRAGLEVGSVNSRDARTMNEGDKALVDAFILAEFAGGGGDSYKKFDGRIAAALEETFSRQNGFGGVF